MLGAVVAGGFEVFLTNKNQAVAIILCRVAGLEILPVGEDGFEWRKGFILRTIGEHPEFSRLLSAMRRLHADGRGDGLDATVFRAAHPRYAQMPDLVSGVGAMVKGSRWNAPGALTVLHAAMTRRKALWRK